LAVSFPELISQLKSDTWRSAALVLPELVLCASIVVLLFVRLPRLGRRIDSFLIALAGCAAALAAQAWSVPGIDGPREEMFTGLLMYDPLTVYFRVFLLVFAALFFILTKITGVPDTDAAPDIYTLVLGSTLGMCLMASANHLLIVFLAVEMASVPSYALAGLLKGRRKSSEAALKYAVYGAGAAGVMLYGISLLAGSLGSAHLPTMAARLAERLNAVQAAGPGATGEVIALVLGGLMLAVGLAFKLSAVPFHFWCPDVFEGATAEVNAFLSVASKGAALALLVRVAVGLNPPANVVVVQLAATPGEAQAIATDGSSSALNIAPEQPAGSEVWRHRLRRPVAELARVPATPAHIAIPFGTRLVSFRDANQAARGSVQDFIVGVVAFIAVITCTFGNLAAYGQTNIKRMLAYSTIAHAGYMMMPVAAAAALIKTGQLEQAQNALASLAFYVVVYLFMNLGAFAVVAFLRNELRSEQIADYAGLARRCPTMAVCFSIMLLSLVGLPPLAGFAGKFLIFVALTDAQLWTLLVIAGLNTALGLFYYLRVVKVMTIDPEPESRLPVSFSPLSAETLFVVAVTVPIVVFGVFFSGLVDVARQAAGKLLSS
jgi:NADH-quinone oxidoreductase subunit N